MLWRLWTRNCSTSEKSRKILQISYKNRRPAHSEHSEHWLDGRSKCLLTNAVSGQGRPDFRGKRGYSCPDFVPRPISSWTSIYQNYFLVAKFVLFSFIWYFCFLVRRLLLRWRLFWVALAWVQNDITAMETGAYTWPPTPNPVNATLTQACCLHEIINLNYLLDFGGWENIHVLLRETYTRKQPYTSLFSLLEPAWS